MLFAQQLTPLRRPGEHDENNVNGLPADNRQAVFHGASPECAKAETHAAPVWCHECQWWIDFKSDGSTGPCPVCPNAAVIRALSAPSHPGDEGVVPTAFVIDGKGDFRVRGLGE